MKTSKLTLDDVLRKLQTAKGMTAVTETDKIKGGIALLDGCHLPTTEAMAVGAS